MLKQQFEKLFSPFPFNIVVAHERQNGGAVTKKKLITNHFQERLIATSKDFLVELERLFASPMSLRV